jgi:hypothetical protein
MINTYSRDIAIRYLKNASANSHVRNAKKQFRKLLSLTEQIAEEATSNFEDLKKQKRYFVAQARNLEELQAYLIKFFGSLDVEPRVSSRHNTITYLLRDVHLDPDVGINKAVSKVEQFANDAYQWIELARSQQNIRDIIPEDIRVFLPKNVVVEVDPDGYISKITDKFANAKDTIDLKIKKLRNLIKAYNKIAKTVKKDLKSSNQKIRISATITAIILETGIRPGEKVGKATIKDEAGEKIEIETFGASTLRLRHINYVNPKLIILEFRGKMGTPNKVAITDPLVVKVLMEYAENIMSLPKSRKEVLENSLFTLEDGRPFTYKMFMTYFKNRVHSKISPKVLRSLKATETLLEELSNQQKLLYDQILSFVEEETEELKERITEEIKNTIEKAVLQAQQKLHHDSFRSTVDYYASPQIILNFLSQGGVENNLKKEIVENTPKLQFNPNVFLERALQQKSASPIFKKIPFVYRVADTLKEILEDLEIQLQEGN